MSVINIKVDDSDRKCHKCGHVYCTGNPDHLPDDRKTADARYYSASKPCRYCDNPRLGSLYSEPSGCIGLIALGSAIAYVCI